MRKKMSTQPPPAPTASAVGPCPSVIQIVGRPGTGSFLIYPFSILSPSLWETARYRLKYCLKGPLNPKQPTNQPNNIEKHFVTVIPSWCMKKPDILFDLHTSKKSASDSLIMKQNFISSSHVTQSINIFILMVPKTERKLGAPFYMETTSVLCVFLMALLCLLQKQKQ